MIMLSITRLPKFYSAYMPKHRLDKPGDTICNDFEF